MGSRRRARLASIRHAASMLSRHPSLAVIGPPLRTYAAPVALEVRDRDGRRVAVAVTGPRVQSRLQAKRREEKLNAGWLGQVSP